MSQISLVTGGAGFIGSHLVEALAARGERVRVLDDLSTGRRDNLAAVAGRIDWFEGDVADPDLVARATAGCDVVYHLAARASVQHSLDDPLGSHRAIATGALTVLEAARRAGVRRVVYAGSASAYGLPASDTQSEADLPRALSPYAAAKLAGEHYCQAFTASFGLETVVLRFFNIYGPRQRADSPYSGVIALFAAAMRQGRRPRIFGDGEQSRDFTHVADVVQALQKAAGAPAATGNTYNIGTGRRVSLLDLAATLNRLLGTHLVPEHGPPRAGDVRHSCADIRAARRDLDYEPGTSFADGLADLLRAEV